MPPFRAVSARLAALAFAALAASAAMAQGSAETIRIGFLTVRTGALAAGGKQMEEGMNLFLKERNYTLAGRKVQVIEPRIWTDPEMRPLPRPLRRIGSAIGLTEFLALRERAERRSP